MAAALGGMRSYEKLEHVGDSLLIGSKLVANDTLAILSRHYGLPAAMLGNAVTVSLERNSTTTQADLFEAHVAAVFYDGRDNDTALDGGLGAWHIQRLMPKYIEASAGPAHALHWTVTGLAKEGYGIEWTATATRGSKRLARAVVAHALGRYLNLFA
ncbi:hypothetical protein Q5752_004319 [Cryptotrichosporon argae]